MSTTSRFSAVTRRAALQGVSLSVLAGVASACSNPDAELGNSTGAQPTGAPTTGVSSAGTVTQEASDTSGSGAGVPDSAKASVAFTFAVSDGGDRVKNPYIAVWIEDSKGEYLATVALWYEAGKGDRWLNSLTRWYEESQGDTSVSSGTQVPGSYTVDWDATINGTKISAGDYFVCVEASREHGPYELVRGTVTLGDQGSKTTMEPQGELTEVTVTWSV